MYKQKIKISEHWLITLLSALRLNMGQRSGALTRKKIKTQLKWFKEGQPIAVLQRWWATLDGGLQNRRCDARLLMFYKIIYGPVAIPVPSYFERPEVYIRHPPPLTYIQMHTSVCYYQYCFSPMTVVLWNRLPADLVLNPDLDFFKAGVRKINHAHP